ncbi:MAG: hypothetical protein E6713_13305 [Sporomusaceae bacterium]|nr:hypothetical protein [Sporomusaceae bacterium]
MSDQNEQVPLCSKIDAVSVNTPQDPWRQPSFSDNSACHTSCPPEHPLDTNKTIHCFWELRQLSHEIFRCIGCSPSERRLLTLFTCLILEDLNTIYKEVAECKRLLCCLTSRDE